MAVIERRLNYNEIRIPPNLNLALKLMNDMPDATVIQLVVAQIFDQIIRNFSLMAITVSSRFADSAAMCSKYKSVSAREH